MYLIIIIIVVLLVIIIKSFYDIFYTIINFYFREHINRYLLFRNIDSQYKKVLISSCQYYNDLPGKDKTLFERRVQKFINKKTFIPRGDLSEISTEMKALISASAIQITFGYPGVYFSYFWQILVYPDDYYSQITRKYHQGEVNSKGYIVLSWKNFVEGYKNSDDGRNLGLHEMAHALQLENAMINREYDFIDFEIVKKFDLECKNEMDRINHGQSSFFRYYAGTNRHEFFAVAVENFFERPQEFKAYHPYLFKLLCQYLKQNPLNKQSSLPV